MTLYDITAIQTGQRKRPADTQKVQSLADSIRTLGLLNPITISPSGRLLAGMHRLEACKLLGWSQIPTTTLDVDDLHAELAEIDENLIRNELSELQQDVQLARRKVIYEQLHPEAKYNSKERMSAVRHAENISTCQPSFAADAATKTGTTERTIRNKTRIGEKLADIADDLIGTAVEDNQSELLTLTKLPEEQRREVTQKIKSGEAQSVKEARKAIQREQTTDASAALDLPFDTKRTVEPGDVWKLGRHTLYCGDTSNEAFISLLDDKAAFAFADPPYNAGVDEWDSDFVWAHDYLYDYAPLVAVTPGIASIFDFARATQMPYRWSMACWIDNGMTRGAMGYGNWIYIALFGDNLYQQAQDILRVTIDTKATQETTHRGRKPLDLLVHLLNLYTSKGDLIIDPFLGSGTTLYAAEATGRACIGGELNPAYCSDIIARWERKTGGEAVKL